MVRGIMVQARDEDNADDACRGMRTVLTMLAVPSQVNNVVATKKGSALALSFLYMASARQLGVPLRALNCTARMKVPVDFIVRHDPADGEGADSMAIFVDLAQQGKVMGVEAVPQDTHFEGTQGAVPHVQLYSRVMHKLADGYARIGQVSIGAEGRRHLITPSPCTLLV